MIVRHAIRAWSDGKLVLNETIGIPEKELDQLLPKLMEGLARILAPECHMIEIEFLDEPDLNERFFRFGTDPKGMVMPVAIDLEKEL